MACHLTAPAPGLVEVLPVWWGCKTAHPGEQGTVLPFCAPSTVALDVRAPRRPCLTTYAPLCLSSLSEGRPRNSFNKTAATAEITWSAARPGW